MQPSRPSKSVIVSIAAILMAAIVCLLQVPGLIGAALPPDADGGAIKAELAAAVEEHRGGQETYKRRFDGRSAFFRPPAPVRQPTVVTREKVRPEPKPEPPPPPRIYTGPKPAFVIGPEVYFEGGTKLRVGEEFDGVKLVETDPPWTITLEQHGKSHVIEIFERSSTGLSPSSSGSSKSGSYLPPGMTVVEPAEELAKGDGEAPREPTGN